MSKTAFFAVIILVLFMLQGCATMPMSSNAETESLRSKVNSLQAELDRQKNENLLLKQQLDSLLASKKQVRMPNAKEIQTALKKAGYYKGTIDGQIGTQTKESVKKFQSANGLTPDGVVGSRTWQLLSVYLDTKQ